MHTATDVDSLRDRMRAEGKSKAEIVQAISAACLGWPYVFGAWGCECTPENRRTYMNRCKAKHADYAAKIRDNCPVLSGKQTTCNGCKWVGTRCFDCRGFTHWLLEQVGLQLYGGTVTTQLDTKSNWVVRGDIAAMPSNLVSCIFRKGHTGMYVLDGATRHCSTVVKQEPMPGKPPWVQYGIPAGLYTTEELKEAGIDVEADKNVPTIRIGASGDLVKYLQMDLNEEMDAQLEVDGIFGKKTETAVKEFQKLHGLTVDGICGSKTWEALKSCEDRPGEPADDPALSETVNVPRTELAMTAAYLEELARIIRKWMEVE